MTDPLFEVYAVKYATRNAKAHEHFYGSADPHENYDMPMDYFIWAAKSDQCTVVIDAGFNAQVAAARNRTFLRCPVETLKTVGIDPGDVPYVVVTHFHYDHIGNLDKFPKANFVLQEAEMAFWTGKYVSRPAYRHLVEAEDVVHLVKENFAGRLTFLSGDREIVPGITVYQAGGHSPGLQFVKVRTAGGHVILASDVSHYYANLEEDRPFSVIHDLAGMYGAFDKVRAVCDAASLIVPGHDPLVMQRFAAASPGLEGIVVRIA